jgi:hypothetical protein
MKMNIHIKEMDVKTYNDEYTPFDRQRMFQGNVYKIVNNFDELVYVDSTRQTLKDRWAEHIEVQIHELQNAGRKLYIHIKKHGVAHFRIELIDYYYCKNENELLHWESYWIQCLRTHRTGLNMKVDAHMKTDAKPTCGRWKIDTKKHRRAVRYLKGEIKVGPTFVNKNPGMFSVVDDILMCVGKEVIPVERVLKEIDENPLIIVGGRDSFYHYVGISRGKISTYLRTHAQ